MRSVFRSVNLIYFLSYFFLFSSFQNNVLATTPGGELRIVSQHAPRSLGIPYTSNGRPSMYYWRAIYDTLTEIDINDQLSSSLAVSWTSM